MKKSLALVAAASSIALILSGCTPGDGGGDGKIVLDFPSFQFDEPGTQDFWNEAIAKFEDENPDVTINFVNASGSDWTNTLTTAYAAGDPPEITHLYARDFQVFASQDWLAPLDDCLADTDVIDNWTPLQSESVWDGQNEALLLLSYAYHLYYNQAMLDAADVAVPTTPEEFVSTVKALNESGVVGFAALTTTDKETFTEASMFVTGMGASWTDGGKYTLTAPGTIDALNVWREIAKTAPEGLGEQQRNELFLNGQAAMMLDGNYFWAYTQGAGIPEVAANAGITLAPFPKIPGAVSNSLAIPASASDEVKAAACDFLAVVASPEMQKRYSELVQVPAPGPDSVPDSLKASFPQIEMMAEAGAKATSVYPPDAAVTENYGEFSKIVIEGLTRLISTDDDTATVMQDVQTQLESAVPLG